MLDRIECLNNLLLMPKSFEVWEFYFNSILNLHIKLNMLFTWTATERYVTF